MRALRSTKKHLLIATMSTLHRIQGILQVISRQQWILVFLLFQLNHCILHTHTHAHAHAHTLAHVHAHARAHAHAHAHAHTL